MRKKAFILGYLANENLNLAEFEVMAQILFRHGYEPIIPHTLFDEFTKETLTKDDIIRVLAIEILQSEIVVTMKDWEEFTPNLKLVSIAHDFEIKVESFVKFLN
jgi:hypothetical protein